MNETFPFSACGNKVKQESSLKPVFIQQNTKSARAANQPIDLIHLIEINVPLLRLLIHRCKCFVFLENIRP